MIERARWFDGFPVRRLAWRVGLDVDGGIAVAIPPRAGALWRLARIGPSPAPASALRLPESTREFALGLREMVEAFHLGGASVALSVPSRQVVMRALGLPTTRSRRVFERAAEAEIERTMALSAEPRRWGAYPLGGEESHTRTWMVAVTTVSSVQPWVDLMRWASLRPVVAEPGILAACRVLTRLEPSEEPRGIVLLGTSGLEAAIVRDGVVAVRRFVDWRASMADLTPSMVGELGELDQVRAFLRRQEPGMTRLYMIDALGLPTRIERDDETWLRGRTDIESLDAKVAWFPRSTEDAANLAQASWTVARGLAMSGERA